MFGRSWIQILSGTPFTIKLFLCRLHYTEYLVELINDSLIDPAELMTSDELRIVLNREYIGVPEQNERQTADEYQLMLLRVSLASSLQLLENSSKK